MTNAVSTQGFAVGVNPLHMDSTFYMFFLCVNICRSGGGWSQLHTCRVSCLCVYLFYYWYLVFDYTYHYYYKY